MKHTVKINQKQARDFARAVYADITEYINNHIEEYQRFLAEEYFADDTSAINYDT